MAASPTLEPSRFRLSLLYAVVFVEIGIAMPFMPVWLAALGLDASVIGLLLALPIATRIVATAPLMSLIDHGVGARALLLTGSLALAATYALMPAGAGIGWPALALLVLLNAVAGAPLVPSIDYLTLAAVRRQPRLDYARIRMSGSVAFLIANLAGGALLTAMGETLAVPLLLTGLALIASAVAFTSRSVAAPAPEHAGGLRPRLPLRLKLCVAAAAAIQASHAAIYAFGSIHWTAHGFSTATVGALWGVGVVAEIVLFACVARLPAAWRTPFRYLALGGGAALVRAVGMYALGDTLPALVGLQALHGLTFGATQLGAMAAVSAFAPDGARGRAQGTLSAANATAAAGATLLSGFAYRAGGPLVFLAMAPLAVAGLALTAAAASRAAARGPVTGQPPVAVRHDTDRQP
ncbi:MFS transporter [Methylobacterium sp. WL30]|uniref:MFS transporter n=1 Tax=unclassified Methylobacterium TaxID=2615210 RepID=UPI0011C8CA34|nr:MULTISPECIES: MFS transporter [unclassified Methylobacterium]TXN39692.1 MFS transporter [Methylobacterium sp. WL93]TXN50088.1 MFS transporter [Methylobacterium sp. WL119]TXN65220.1 MFS transporter [Methylobacterium sp. WL30]